MLILKIWRVRKEIDDSVPMKVRKEEENTGNLYDALPRYYVYAGLVFTPLTLDYVKTFGRNWRNVANLEMIYELYYRKNEKPETARKEPVVLAATLAHPVNADIRLASRAMINEINGKRIESLEDIIEALEKNKKNQHLIKFGSGTIESLNTEAANNAHKNILETYSIPSDRRL